MSRVRDFYEMIDILRDSVRLTLGAKYLDYNDEFYFENMPLKKKLCYGLLHLNFFIFNFLLLLNCYMNRSDILSFLSAAMYLLLFLGSADEAWLLYHHRWDLFCGGLKQCETLHSTRTVLEERFCAEIIDKTGSQSLFIVKLFRVFGTVGVLGAIFLGTVASYFTEDTKYLLPIPMKAFVIEPTGWFTYSINFISVSLSCINGGALYIGAVSIGLVTAINGLARFNCIMELCKNMNEIVAESSFNEFCHLVMKHLHLIREFLDGYSGATSPLFYFMQFQSYTTLFTSWFILTTNVSAIGQAVPGIIILTSLGIIVLFNEAFISKFEDLAAAFYEAEWYNLPVNDQKAFIIFLSMAQNPIVLTAGGINDLTLDWYSGLFNQAYNTALYITDFM